MIDKTESQIMKNWNRKDTLEPLVSIYCTAYNHENYIAQALDSFLVQETTFPFEIVIHDDASTDRTAHIIKEYETTFPSIVKPIYEKENQYSKKDESLTKISLVKILYRNVKGKYIALCEGDDYWCDKRKIQQQAEILEKNQQCTIVFSKCRFVEKSGRDRKYTAPPNQIFKEGIITLPELVNSEFGKGNWTFHTSSFFYKSELGAEFIKIRQDEFKMFPYGDMPLQLFCLLKGKGYYIDKVQSCYRVMSGGYNSYINKHPEVAILHQTRLIEALKNFDNLTNKKYHKDILSGINRAEFKIDVLSKNIIGIMKSKYSEIGMYMRLKMLVKIIFPSLYDCLVLLKHPI